MSTAVIVVSTDELRALVRDAVREALEGRVAEPAIWLDAKGAAELLNVNERTVARLAKRGELAYSRVGKLLRFERAAVVSYLEGKR